MGRRRPPADWPRVGSAGVVNLGAATAAGPSWRHAEAIAGRPSLAGPGEGVSGEAARGQHHRSANLEAQSDRRRLHRTRLTRRKAAGANRVVVAESLSKDLVDVHRLRMPARLNSSDATPSARGWDKESRRQENCHGQGRQAPSTTGQIDVEVTEDVSVPGSKRKAEVVWARCRGLRDMEG